MPASNYCSPSGKQLWSIEGDELEQLKDDRQTFDQYFRPNYDFRFLIRIEIDAISSFMRDHLNLAHWELPTDNASIECILRQSVKDGRMVPIVNRERRTPAQTYRPKPAPLRWPQLSGGGGPALQPVPYGGLSAAISSGATAVERASSGNSNGLDWLGIAALAAGAVGAVAPGAYVALDDDGEAAAVDKSTRLGGTRPFDYTPDALHGAIEELAGVGNRGDMYACDIISAECKGSVLRVFPGQYLNSTLNDIQSDVQDGVKDARKALKLLNDGRFKK